LDLEFLYPDTDTIEIEPGKGHGIASRVDEFELVEVYCRQFAISDSVYNVCKNIAAVATAHDSVSIVVVV
jgi:hypothetical protein